VDTSLRSCGFAVVEQRGSKHHALEHGRIRNPPTRSVAQSLAEIHRELARVIDEHAPDAVAVEGIFYCRSVKTALRLGEARGAVIALSALNALEVFEYAPKRVKLAVVGFGAADKSQVSKMVQSMLGLEETPQEDAGDALAIAICHLNARSQHAALAPKAL